VWAYLKKEKPGDVKWNFGEPHWLRKS
jgi:hypothetical protein